MMSSRAEEAKSLISNEVSGFIDEVQTYTDDPYEQLPTTSIFTSNTFRHRKHEYSVAQPSKIVRDTNRLKRFYFNDLVEELIDNDLSFCPSRSDEIKRHSHRKRIFQLAKFTLDYIGAVNFEQDAFEAAYADHFAPLYTSTHTHRIVFPLPRVILRSNDFRDTFSLELPPLDRSIDNGRYLSEFTDNLVLNRITDTEMMAMQTYGTPGLITTPDQTQKRLGWTTKLEMQLEVTHRPTKYSDDCIGIDLGSTGNHALSIAKDIAKQIMTVIRLWNPKQYAGLGPGYLLHDSWKTYRDICADVSRIFIPEFCQQGKTHHHDPIKLHESEQDSVRDFWCGVAPYCSLAYNTNNSLRQSVERFNRMYERSFLGGQVVDAFIGFETTLIRGNHAKIMADRGSLLLKDHNGCCREETRDFLDGIRQIRNRIVHSDAILSEDLLSEYSGPNKPRSMSETSDGIWRGLLLLILTCSMHRPHQYRSQMKIISHLLKWIPGQQPL